MSRHGRPVEHVPQRRWLPFLKPKRCRCGDPLPCFVKATLDRLPFFETSARPSWNEPTAMHRPLMTPGQQNRSGRRLPMRNQGRGALQ